LFYGYQVWLGNSTGKEGKMTDQMVEITVEFTEQQLEVLDKIKDENIFGDSYEEIALNMFRSFIMQNFGEKGA
jgi:hypothetical protein